jgi:hypothetical protein
MQNWITIDGIVQQGYQVASGLATNSPYEQGTIALQIPVFQALGFDLSRFFPATLNVSITPTQFAMHQPEFTFRQVEWTDRHPPEDFSFSRCRLEFATIQYDGFVYYPHPETKRNHWQNSSLLEILAPQISGIAYGDRLALWLNPTEIHLITPSLPDCPC